MNGSLPLSQEMLHSNNAIWYTIIMKDGADILERILANKISQRLNYYIRRSHFCNHATK